MPHVPPADPLAALQALLQRYMRGEVSVADMVAAYEAIPNGASGDFAFSLGDIDPELAEARMAALAQSLGPPRAG